MMKISNGIFKRANLVMSILCFIFFLCLLIIPQEYTTAGIAVTAVPAAAAFIIYLKQSRRSTFIANRQNLIISVMMAILYEIMLSVTNLYGTSFSPISEYLAGKLSASKQLLLATITTEFCIMTFVSVVAVIYFCISLLCKELPCSSGNQHKPKLYVNFSKLRINKYLLPIFILTIVFAVSAFWGYDHPDTQTVTGYIKNGTYNQWHTVCYELFVKCCMDIFGEKLYLTPVIIAQAVIFIAVQNYVLNVICDYFNSRKALQIYTVAACIVVSPVYYVSLVIKDSVFSAFMLGFSAAVFNFVKTEKVKTKDYAALALMGIGASLFRHFGVVVVAMSFAALFIYQFFFKQRKIQKNGS